MAGTVVSGRPSGQISGGAEHRQHDSKAGHPRPDNRWAPMPIPSAGGPWSKEPHDGVDGHGDRGGQGDGDEHDDPERATELAPPGHPSADEGVGLEAGQVEAETERSHCGDQGDHSEQAGLVPAVPTETPQDQ